MGSYCCHFSSNLSLKWQAYNVCKMDQLKWTLTMELGHMLATSLLTPDLFEWVGSIVSWKQTNHCHSTIIIYACTKKCKIKPLSVHMYTIQVFMMLEWHWQIQMLLHSLSVVEQSIQRCFYPFHSVYCVLKHITGHMCNTVYAEDNMYEYTKQTFCLHTYTGTMVA